VLRQALADALKSGHLGGAAVDVCAPVAHLLHRVPHCCNAARCGNAAHCCSAVYTAQHAPQRATCSLATHDRVRTHSNTGVRAHTTTADALSRVLQADFITGNKF
jgi:hypothetical protein